MEDLNEDPSNGIKKYRWCLQKEKVELGTSTIVSRPEKG